MGSIAGRIKIEMPESATLIGVNFYKNGVIQQINFDDITKCPPGTKRMASSGFYLKSLKEDHSAIANPLNVDSDELLFEVKACGQIETAGENAKKIFSDVKKILADVLKEIELNSKGLACERGTDKEGHEIDGAVYCYDKSTKLILVDGDEDNSPDVAVIILNNGEYDYLFFNKFPASFLKNADELYKKGRETVPQTPTK